MDLFYVSPSILPSRTANSVHVVRMCEALSKLGHKVTLFFYRTTWSDQDIHKQIHEFYGVDLKGVRLVSAYSPFSKGHNFWIAQKALLTQLKEMLLLKAPQIVISRNLYASFVLKSIPGVSLLFETHQLEFGFRKQIQRQIMKSSRVKTIVISQALKDLLNDHHQTTFHNTFVFPDAAPAGIAKLSVEERKTQRDLKFPPEISVFPHVAGYFGQLLQGRGVEIIEALAKKFPHVAFAVWGGDEKSIRSSRERNTAPNLFYMGFVSNQQALDYMRLVDALLMPYQEKVSIGAKGHYDDTSRWMSPMKLFEYMASGVPLISSRLPALQEILNDGENALLAAPANVEEWAKALQKILTSPDQAERIANKAYQQYQELYNWESRTQKMLELGHQWQKSSAHTSSSPL